MRIPSRHRMAMDRLPVRAAAWLMAILLWTSVGGHLVAESHSGASESGAASMAGAGSIPTGIPEASPTALLGPACDSGRPTKLGDKLPLADCVLCEALEAPASATAPAVVAVPPPSAVVQFWHDDHVDWQTPAIEMPVVDP